MSLSYDHKSIEEKWGRRWEEDKIYFAQTGGEKEKSYLLIEFPYPSGEGLHVGHVRSYTAMDVIARTRRAQGKNVLYPIGWDAFGLPTENYAVKTGIHPKEVTKQNTDNFRRQLKALGFSFDWSREINTTDPQYYKWTQWIFTKLFEKGLAYKARMPINWCLSCKIGLANEEVVDGKCERCGGETEKREKEQWMLKITKYADRLHDDLDGVDYWDRIKIQQRNWIGRSEGWFLNFKLDVADETVSVFTTRPDTLFGATYMVLAPEHPLVDRLRGNIQNGEEVQGYVAQAYAKSDIERTAEGKEKTGIELKGVKAMNPANGVKIPIFIADYVLAHYGTGAIMAVPAHDERDFAFAKKHVLLIQEVIDKGARDLPYEGEGTLKNSEHFDGLMNTKAKAEIAQSVGGEKRTIYKLRDWIFSRQRYWGEPIPMIHCKTCGWIPVPLADLPVELPDIQNYKPSENGESPLAEMHEWVETKCPKCKGPAHRETDTMPNWAGSSWYYLRYTDPRNEKELASKESLNYWTPVDWYNGGMEHTTLHLLYSRFWHKFLFDLGLVPSKEPYAKRTSHGIILAKGGEKMSKSKGNVINPNDMIEKTGADALRVYEMFTGPFDQSFAWNTDNMIGARRFLERVWRMKESLGETELSAELDQLLNQTIKKVGTDIEALKFNTAISQLMILGNALEKEDTVPMRAYRVLIKLLSPFAPFVTEELWFLLGGETSVHLEPWPDFDEGKLYSKDVVITVQVNGKVRGELSASATLSKEEIEERARALPQTKRHMAGKQIQKVIYVEKKLINFVSKE